MTIEQDDWQTLKINELEGMIAQCMNRIEYLEITFSDLVESLNIAVTDTVRRSHIRKDKFYGGKEDEK